MRIRAALLSAVPLLLAPACALEVDGGMEEDPELEEIEAVGANLLANPGFEAAVVQDRCSAADNYDCIRTGAWGLHGAGAVRMEAARRQHREGQPSRWGVRLTGGAERVYFTQRVQVRGGKDYRFRVMVRGCPPGSQCSNVAWLDEDAWNMQVRFPDLHEADGVGGVTVSMTAVPGETGWRKRFIDMTAPETATTADVQIVGFNEGKGIGAVGSIDFDDLVFAPLSD